MYMLLNNKKKDTLNLLQAKKQIVYVILSIRDFQIIRNNCRVGRHSLLNKIEKS